MNKTMVNNSFDLNRIIHTMIIGTIFFFLVSAQSHSYNWGDDWKFAKCPKCKTWYKHVGLDVSAKKGDHVYFKDDYYFRHSSSDGQWQYYVVASNANNNKTYVVWHLSNVPKFKDGESINGKLIGSVADLGNNTHIHVGLREGGFSPALSQKGALPGCVHRPEGLPAFPEQFIKPDLKISFNGSGGSPLPPEDNTRLTRLNDIKKLYIDVLGREADQSGLNSYFSSNQSLDAIRQSMLNSAECRQGKGGECKKRYSQSNTARYSIRISNIDDEGTCKVNGDNVKTVGFYQDSGWVDITNKLHSGKNEIKFKVLEKGGGYAYHFGVQKNGTTIWQEKCGEVGKKGCTTKKLKKGDTLTKTYKFEM
jgi:hypothetical protein